MFEINDRHDILIDTLNCFLCHTCMLCFNSGCSWRAHGSEDYYPIIYLKGEDILTLKEGATSEGYKPTCLCTAGEKVGPKRITDKRMFKIVSGPLVFPLKGGHLCQSNQLVRVANAKFRDQKDLLVLDVNYHQKEIVYRFSPTMNDSFPQLIGTIEEKDVNAMYRFWFDKRWHLLKL